MIVTSPSWAITKSAETIKCQSDEKYRSVDILRITHRDVVIKALLALSFGLNCERNMRINDDDDSCYYSSLAYIHMSISLVVYVRLHSLNS